jgi:hypothetical protein
MCWQNLTCFGGGQYHHLQGCFTYDKLIHQLLRNTIHSKSCRILWTFFLTSWKVVRFVFGYSWFSFYIRICKSRWEERNIKMSAINSVKVYHLAMYVQSNRYTILLYNRVYSRINALYNVSDLHGSILRSVQAVCAGLVKWCISFLHLRCTCLRNWR